MPFNPESGWITPTAALVSQLLRFINSLAYGPQPRSADFQICRIADFQVGRVRKYAGVLSQYIRRFGNLRYGRFGNLRYGFGSAMRRSRKYVSGFVEQTTKDAASLRTAPLRVFAVNPLLFLVTFQPLPLIIDPSVKAKIVGLWSRIFNMTSS